MKESVIQQNRIIADWDYWLELKSRTLDAANNQSWRRTNQRHRIAQQNKQYNYLQRWAKSKMLLLNKKNN